MKAQFEKIQKMSNIQRVGAQTLPTTVPTMSKLIAEKSILHLII